MANTVPDRGFAASKTTIAACQKKTRRGNTPTSNMELTQRLSKGHGGRRKGAGRPRGKNYAVAHRARPALSRHFPVHVTLRCRDGLPILLESGAFAAMVRAIRGVRGLPGFRITHYSIQPNHVHLLCEADSKEYLAKGMRSVATRMTRGFNRVFARTGTIWNSRYHARILRSPREVRVAIVYVLGNHRHHGGQHEPRGTIDSYSSARWFDGFREAMPPLPEGFVPPTSEACSWLLSVGWQRHGLISVDEGPRPK